MGRVGAPAFVETLATPFTQQARVSCHVKASQNDDLLRRGREVNQVRESEDDSPAKAAVDDRIGKRCLAQVSEDPSNLFTELGTEPRAARLVPILCVHQIALGERPNDNP